MTTATLPRPHNTARDLDPHRPDLITRTIDATPKWLEWIGGRVFILAILIILGTVIQAIVVGMWTHDNTEVVTTVFWGVVTSTTGKKGLGALGDAIRATKSQPAAPRVVTSNVVHVDPSGDDSDDEGVVLDPSQPLDESAY